MISIAAEFKRHAEDLMSLLDDFDKVQYVSIMQEKADYAKYSGALLFLTQLLRKKYNKRVLVLIDEYDAPIHAAYAHDYYTEMDCLHEIAINQCI